MIPSVLASQLIKGTKDYLKTTFPSSTPAFFDMMDRFVNEDGKLFKGPYISVALPFKKGESDINYFPDILDDSFKPYYHQELAFKRLSGTNPKPTLVATGTGSGKTEAFMFPILDYCYKSKDTNGIKAIIIYPMNALATDQAKRFAKTISKTPALKDIRVGLYIGDSEQNPQGSMSKDYVITDKKILQDNPPDILLTNYKMLDFMLMRPRDQKIWKYNIDNEILKYIAVDEIHTFDGASGTDLASLIRRLKAKLKIKKAQIAPVGTSATLGSDGTKAIREFASDIFGEEFDSESVISEYRVDADEFLADSLDDIIYYPHISELKKLDFKSYHSMQEYIKAQYYLWFNEETDDINSDEFKVELGRKLKQLSLFKLLLKTLNGQIQPRDKIVDAFIRKIPIKSDSNYFVYMVNSLLALTSWARSQKVGDGYPPFLFVRVQLWLRELARMVASLDENPTLTYSDDLKTNEQQKYYPVIHCRDCHATGWGGVKKEGSSELLEDLELFYQAFFSSDSRVKFIFPIDKDFRYLSGKVYYIDKNGNELYDEDEKNGIRVYEPKNIVGSGKKQGKSHNDCPFCNAKNALTILGARASSLTSVLIGQNFTSYYNDDKKLIAFSDSVQDSAHRAGFFGARSYQFTIRSAMQQALDAYGGKVSLNGFGAIISKYWQDRFKDDKQYVATLIAPDMEWLKSYDDLVKTDELKNPKDIMELINKRIDWMVYSEYGFKSHIGRTLERSNASVMYIAGIKNIVDLLLDRVENEIESLRGISKRSIEQFLWGIVTYMKNIGAIDSEHLEPFILGGGDTYAINQLKPRNLYMAKFSPNARNPKFLTNGGFKEFEKISNKTKSSWFDRWIMFNFFDKTGLTPDTLAVMRIVFEVLIKEKFLFEKEVKGSLIWGLNPEKLYITNQTKQLKCSKCKHILTINQDDEDIVIDMPCLRKECDGRYDYYSDNKDSYYKLLYSYGDLQRVVAREHTGLLDRKTREKIENEFIKRKPTQSWKTNLLSATPTLEMGIDIGDLSSVILCSTPPNGANYLQRIGRAGRKDGNAFNATIANASNHDLYFYEEPNEIMQGDIEAPGIYLDASAILQRQFLAFCIDSWVSNSKITTKEEFPDKLRVVLSNVEKNKMDKFPYTLFKYIETNRSDLLDSFFDLYDDRLQESSKSKLIEFVKGSENKSGLVYFILNRLKLLIQEKNSLSKQIVILKKKLKEHEKQEAKDKDHEQKTKEISGELNGLKSILRIIRKKQTFEFFADEGLLPNYAFPESGVVLKSIIYRRKDSVSDDSGSRYEKYTYEYERAGSSAISELAPHNSFYAGGRKVTIDQIDMSVSQVEEWRFCDKCSYTELVTSDKVSECPKCGSLLFADNGQKKEILRMRQVLATSDDKSSRLKDDKDQRDIKFFNKQLLINFDTKNIEDAYAVTSDETTFGFEFIKSVNFKEINFGETTLIGNDVAIAGKKVPRKGFIICKDCGKVQSSKPTDAKFKPNHSFSCSIEDTTDPNNYIESLYLYREFDSEAIRLMLPVSSLDIDEEKLHSLIASFQLGLKKYFKGSVEHLKVGIYDEVDTKDEYSKRYLILYDTVPGGTGYLMQLSRDKKPLFEVLEAALSHLKNCSCNKDANKDGCYRCIYAYKNNFDRPLISKRKAIEIIEKILKSKETIQKVQTVSDIKSDSLSESVLEELFISRLKNISNSWKESITSRGNPGYQFELINDKNEKLYYELEHQVPMKDDIKVYSIADFVIYPMKNSNAKPIAIFTDGFAYHENRVATDSAQRMAIVKSGKFIVWSLTWEDIEEFNKKSPNYKYKNYLNDINIDMFKRLYKGKKEFLNQTSFEWLIALLKDNNITDTWEDRAKYLSASFIKAPVDTKIFNKVLTTEMFDQLLDSSEEYYGNEIIDDDISIIVGGKKKDLANSEYDKSILALHIQDKLGKIEFGSWAGILRVYNIMQFLPNSIFTTSNAIEDSLYDEIVLTQTKDTNQEWSLVYEEVLDEAKELVKILSKEQKIPIPQVGEELENGVEAELMWEELKIAVVIEADIKLEGWDIFNISDTDKIIQTIKIRIEQ